MSKQESSKKLCTFPVGEHRNTRAGTPKGEKPKDISDPTVQRKYACNYCTHSATAKACLQSHIQRRHSSNYPYACSVPNCNYRAKTKTDLQVHHKNRHTHFTKIPCNFEGCSFKTRFNKDLSAHVLKRHTLNRRKDIECPLCPQKFFTTDQMRAHSMSHTKEKPWKCSLCKYGSKSNGNLRRHLEAVHGKLIEALSATTVLKCNLCDFSTALKERLKRHLISHSSDKPFACKFPGCSYRSKWKHYLEVHETGNHAPERHPCPQLGCKYVGKHERLLQFHFSNVHHKPFRCTFPGCDRRFETESASVNHKRFHDPQRPFQCEQCSLRFCTKVSLSVHIQNRHTEGKKFQCPQSCSYRTKRGTELRSHLKLTHNAEDISCSVPGCKFQSCSPYDMSKHSERHDYRSHPFKCEYCPYGFAHKSNLRSHVKRHHKEKQNQVPKMVSIFSDRINRLGRSGWKLHESILVKQGIFERYLCLQKMPIVVLTKTVIQFL